MHRMLQLVFGNLFDTDAYEIHRTRALMTMMNGDTVYEAPPE